MTVKSVLLIEDNKACREGLAQVVREIPELRLDAAVGTLAEARLQLAHWVPDVCMVDLGLPDGSGVEFIRELVGGHPNALAIVITAFRDEAHVVAAITAGAAGYLLKDASPQEIGRAILDMLAGGSPLSAPIARYVIEHFHSKLPASTGQRAKGLDLSKRELGVLQLIAKGYAYSEIGRGLGVSVNTVREYIRRIYRKLSVTSAGAAVFEAQGRGLIGPGRKPPR